MSIWELTYWNDSSYKNHCLTSEGLILVREQLIFLKASSLSLYLMKTLSKSIIIFSVFATYFFLFCITDCPYRLANQVHFDPFVGTRYYPFLLYLLLIDLRCPVLLLYLWCLSFLFELLSALLCLSLLHIQNFIISVTLNEIDRWFLQFLILLNLTLLSQLFGCFQLSLLLLLLFLPFALQLEQHLQIIKLFFQDLRETGCTFLIACMKLGPKFPLLVSSSSLCQ